MRRSHGPVGRAGVVGALGALATLLCVTLTGTPAQAATTVWVADGYGPGNTGYNAAEAAITTGTVASLAYRWSVVSPVVRDACAEQAPPLVTADKVVSADQRGVAAYRADTGAPVWSFRYPAPADTATPRLAVGGPRVFGAFNGCRSISDPDTVLRAFHLTTGAVLWTAARDAPASVLLVDRGVVVVSGGDATDVRVTAYRVADGAVLWERADTLLPRPVSAGGRVLLRPAEGTGAEQVDIVTGKTLWRTVESWSPLAADGAALYVSGAAGELVRTDAATGAVAWAVPGAAAQLAVDGARLYVAQGTDLVARDLAGGAELWRASFPAQLGKPVVAGGVVYATVSGRLAHPLNAATGAELDADPPYQGAIGHPTVVNGRLYVTDGRVLDAYALA